MPFPGTSLIPYEFSGGLNAQIAEYKLDQPNLETAENIRMNQIGQIDKRPGFTSISDNIMGGGNITNGKEITVFNNELIEFDGEYIYSWQPEEQVWINKGSCFSTQCKQIRVLNTKIATQANPDATTSNGVSVYAWEDNRATSNIAQGVRYSVLNTTTNGVIVSDKLVYSFGASPKVVSDGNNFFIFYCASSNDILYSRIPVNRPNTVQENNSVIVVNGWVPDLSPHIAYDVCIGPENIVWLTYAGSDGFVHATNPSSYGSSQHLTLSAGYALCVASTFDSFGRQWVAWSTSYGTWVNAYVAGEPVFPSDREISSDAACNISIIEGTDKGSAYVSYEIPDGGIGFFNYVNSSIVSSRGIVQQLQQIRAVGLASKLFKQGGNIFMNVIKATSLQSTYLTLCLTHFNIPAVAKHSPSNGGTLRTNKIMAQCDYISQDTFMFAGQRKGAFTSYANAQTTNLGCAGYTLNFDVANSFGNVTSSNNLHIVGGIKKVYDGISCVEDNFHFFPEMPDGFACDVALSGRNGNLTFSSLNASFYQYNVVYEWTDNYGQVQRSGVGVANSFTTTAVNQATDLTFPTLTITDKISPRTPVSISIYRTIANGSVFYKITDDNNPILNDPTVDTLTYTDIQSDQQIAANENLYTGSQLSNTAPPGCSLISQYQTRVMINQDEDVDVIWYSQNKFEQDQYNTLPLDWNTSFVEGVDSKLGSPAGITALGLLDSSLAIFKETAVFLLQGDGPNALDTSGNFNDAFLLVADTGCSEPKSMVFVTQTQKYPGGLLFKSNKGIYLLGRDQSLYAIGKPVMNYNYLTITGAQLLTTTNEIAFTSVEGTIQVYNYYFDAWYTWTGLPCVASTVWQDKLVILNADGSVMIQDDTNTVFVDTFAHNVVNPVQMSLKTPWVKVSGQMQGRACVYDVMLLGIYQSPHVLQVDVSYDYDPSTKDSVLINSNTAANRWGGLPTWGNPYGTWGITSFSNYQYQINFKYPRGYTGAGCQSIQLTISDVDNNVNSQAFSLNGLAFEIAPLAGQFNVPTGNKAGGK